MRRMTIRDRRGALGAAAVTFALLVGGMVSLWAGRGAPGPPQPSPAAARPSVSASPAAPTSGPSAPPNTGPAPGVFPAASDPTVLDIPSIGVHTGHLVGLRLSADGTLQAPARFTDVGWYTGGPTPGELGPAVLGAHVDSHSGPAVFFRLGELRPGARVVVTRADGSVVTFVVDRVAEYAKSAFPTALVYGNSSNRAEIRLITCGGAFDRSTGHYVDNIVVFGHLIRWSPR